MIVASHAGCAGDTCASGRSSSTPRRPGTRRTVRLLDPLAADLAQWRLATARPADHLPVVPGQDDDAAWSAEGFNKWRQRNFGDALRAVGLERVRPHDLRHSFASLLLHEADRSSTSPGSSATARTSRLAFMGTSSTNSRTPRAFPPRTRCGVPARRSVPAVKAGRKLTP
jgi:integrase